jgi:RNA polymerase-binding protein DksA
MAKTATKTNTKVRRRLGEERQRLLDEIEAMAGSRAQSDDPTLDAEAYSNHPANIGTETYEMEKDLALVGNLRRQLAMTEAAIVRLDEGTYGICTNCGRQIDPERLDALPHASLCIDCKRQQEAGR